MSYENRNYVKVWILKRQSSNSTGTEGAAWNTDGFGFSKFPREQIGSFFPEVTDHLKIKIYKH